MQQVRDNKAAKNIILAINSDIAKTYNLNPAKPKKQELSGRP
ncbi:MAG: hypothetical protein ACXWT1_06310 [Methylobacter sp.]